MAGRLSLRLFAAMVGRAAWLGYGLAPAAGWLSWRLNTGMRRNILRNQIVLVGNDRMRAKANTRAVFNAIVRYYVDLASIGHRDPGQVESKTFRFVNAERLAVLESGRPIIALSAHLGSPELGVQAFIGRGRGFVALVEELEPKWLGDEVNKMRRAAGGRYLAADGRGVRACLQELRNGGIVAIVGDRDIQGNGRCTSLFGREVRLPAGPFELAQRTDAMIVPVLTTRERGDALLLHVEEPFAVGVETGAVEDAVERWASILEHYLSRYPEQWTVAEDFWQVHRCG